MTDNVNIITEHFVDNENPHEHWKYIQCDGGIAIDFGCGRWEQVAYRDPNWPTTPEYLFNRGASKVYAFDVDQNELNWFKENINSENPNIIPVYANLSNVDIFKSIYAEYKPNIVKCDIEHNEIFLLQLTDEEFSSVNFYAIETHTDHLYRLFLEKFINLGYKVEHMIHLTHAYPMKVIFAEKIK